MQVAHRDGEVARGEFPFGLRRQARAAPARVGVGLVQRDVGDRPRQIERLLAVQREFLPAPADIAPVQRVLELAGADPVPAFGQPQRRVAVAAGLDELEVVAIRDQA